MSDFSKAFDTVDFEILIRKLQKLNLSSLKILTSYLSSRRQYVQINDAESQVLPVTNGVPQESILGPVLFNVYDMNTKTDAACHQYADDTSLYRHSKPKDLRTCAITLGKNVNELQGWSKDTKLIFNPKKMKSLLFATQQMARRHQLNFELKSADGKVIERVSNFKLLGVTFSEDLKWNKHVKKAISLKILTRPFNQRKQLAEALVLSRLDYGNALLYSAPVSIFTTNYSESKMQQPALWEVAIQNSGYRSYEVASCRGEIGIQHRETGMEVHNCHDWPKYLPMTKVEARRPMRGGATNEGTFIACLHNISDTFEVNASKVFNELPKKCRDSDTYGSFCRETRKYLMDRALARSYQNAA